MIIKRNGGTMVVVTEKNFTNTVLKLWKGNSVKDTLLAYIRDDSITLGEAAEKITKLSLGGVMLYENAEYVEVPSTLYDMVDDEVFDILEDYSKKGLHLIKVLANTYINNLPTSIVVIEGDKYLIVGNRVTKLC